LILGGCVYSSVTVRDVPDVPTKTLHDVRGVLVPILYRPNLALGTIGTDVVNDAFNGGSKAREGIARTITTLCTGLIVPISTRLMHELEVV
jgi:hypothetical protein